MKRRRNSKASKNTKVIKLWDYPRVQKSLPYLRSLATSLREHWLDANSKRIDEERLVGKPGRVDRDRILATASATREKEIAEEQFNDDIKEMLSLDVYPVDAVQGVVFIPFAKNEELAWFVFDLFDETNLPGWRFHHDPMETRRPLPEALQTTNLLRN